MAWESALLFLRFRRRWSAIQQLLRVKAQALNGLLNSGPVFRQEFLALAFQQKIARPILHVHPETSLLLNQLLVHQFLISLENRKRIEPVISRDRSHRRQRIAFLESAVEDHRDHTVTKLTVNRLIVVPLTVHSGFQFAWLQSRR